MSAQEMWMTGIEISVIVFLSGLLANQYFQRRKDRIDRVTMAYFKVRESQLLLKDFPQEFDALLKAGVTELKTSGEMKTVCNRISATGKRHPNWLVKDLPNRNLLTFLRFCHSQ
jgi:hypothetical protein